MLITFNNVVHITARFHFDESWEEFFYSGANPTEHKLSLDFNLHIPVWVQFQVGVKDEAVKVLWTAHTGMFSFKTTNITKLV